ncbi:hypothetical protein CONPUDRAFT_141531, partial [Coniophora puteana RWD-64-598 SS2]
MTDATCSNIPKEFLGPVLDPPYTHMRRQPDASTLLFVLTIVNMKPPPRLLNPSLEKKDDLSTRMAEMRRFIKLIIKPRPSFEIPPSIPDPRFRRTIPRTPGPTTPATPARSSSYYGSPLSGYGSNARRRSSLLSEDSLSPSFDASPTRAALRRKQYARGRPGVTPPAGQTWPNSRSRTLQPGRSRSYGDSPSPRRLAHSPHPKKIPALCLSQRSLVSAEANTSTASGPVDLSPITEGTETFEGVPTDLSATFSALHAASVAGPSGADLAQATAGADNEDPFVVTKGPSLVVTRATPSPDPSPSSSLYLTPWNADDKPNEDFTAGQLNAITRPCGVNKVASNRMTEDHDDHRELLHPHTPKFAAVDASTHCSHSPAASSSPMRFR